MSGFESFEEAIVAIALLACLALGVLGVLVDRRRIDEADSEGRGVEQERRLENEEDTRDEGPV